MTKLTIKTALDPRFLELLKELPREVRIELATELCKDTGWTVIEPLFWVRLPEAKI